MVRLLKQKAVSAEWLNFFCRSLQFFSHLSKYRFLICWWYGEFPAKEAHQLFKLFLGNLVWPRTAFTIFTMQFPRKRDCTKRGYWFDEDGFGGALKKRGRDSCQGFESTMLWHVWISFIWLLLWTSPISMLKRSDYVNNDFMISSQSLTTVWVGTLMCRKVQ